jgi:hypothetical protein
LRVVDQRARQAQAPRMPPDSSPGLAFGLVRQRGKLQQSRDAFADGGVLHAEIAAIDQQVFSAGEIRVQCVELAHHAQLGLDGQRVLRHLQTQGVDAARVGYRQAQAHADAGGLARAVGADHAQAFAGRNGKRQVVHDRHVTVSLAQVLRFKQGGCHGWYCVAARIFAISL